MAEMSIPWHKRYRPPASITAANAQLSREMGRNIEAGNDRLARLMEQQILETRRMKTYFRDAVRLTTD